MIIPDVAHGIHETHRDRAVRDSRAREFKAQGLIVKRSRLQNINLWPGHLFGSTAERTPFAGTTYYSVLYELKAYPKIEV
jgi:hypothetical protein